MGGGEGVNVVSVAHSECPPDTQTPWCHMETALRTVASTVELLAVAGRCDAVKRWDEPTLLRAFHWAHYCQLLSSRVHRDAAMRGAVERQLQLTNQRLHEVFCDYKDLSFMELSRCQHLLLVGLLNNPELPISLMKMLFDTESVGKPTQGDSQGVSGLGTHIIHCKSACKVLSPLTDLSPLGADAEVQGLMLMERLEALRGQGTEACRVEHFLDSVLQGYEGTEGHLCLVVAAALLTPKNSQTASQDFLLDWLLKNPSKLQHVCSALPTALLTDLAREHQRFRDAYCDVLKKWASDMEYSISEGDWLQSSTNCAVSFQRLTEHFLALFQACPPLREEVEKELNSLKKSDGDFDVRGLSVWGDLLSAFNE